MYPEEVGDERSVRIVCCAVRELDQEIEKSFLVRDRLRDRTAPECGLGEELRVELRYDAKIIVTTLKSTEKGLVLSAARRNDCAICEDDFVGLNVVASEAVAR